MSANSAAAHDLVPIDRRLIDALQNREQRLAQAQRVDLVGSWEWDIAADAVHWSDAVCRIFGSPPGELERTYRDALERLHPDDREVLVRLVSRSLETRCAWAHRHRIVRPGGEVRHVETRGEVIADGDGGVVTMRGTIRDRTESVLLERQFQDVSAALELVRLTASAVHDAPDIEAALRSTLDVVCGAQRRWIGRVWQVRASSPGGLVATGLVSGSSAETWPAPSPLASLALEHREPRALPAVDANGPVVLAAPIEVGPEILYVVEFEGEQPVADLHLLVAAVRSVCSILAQRIGRDIAAVNEALSHDPLTGLSTRTVFLEQVQRALAFGQRNGSATVVFSVDLDDFHRVNDEHGHEGGDKVLVAVANRLRRSLRQHDTVARGSSAITRVGGDEFLMMCETVRDEAAALVIATRLLGTVALPIELDSGEVVVSARIGISMSAIDSKPRQMVIEAEAAQRHAKELGGAHQFFAPEHHQRAAAHAALVEALHRAVAAEEMRLFYQPKISLATNRIVGVEALLRWEHPQRGLVMPDEFIPAAEQSGLVIPISAWVLRESLRQAAVWHQAYPRTPLRLAVNVSARQFRAELPGIISAAIDEAGISATSVCLEMTETTIMDDIDSTVAILEELKELGLTVSIDDFGTGYSSLEYLHRMPIDEVKIDRSFVAGLGSDAVNTAIVASVISLAHAMNLEVVAEGVETLEQLERLRTLGCDFAQGYYIARPMPPAEIDDHLAGDAAGEELPRADPARGVAARPLSETVLVVDDAADVRMLARMSLTAAGFTVEEAGNGAAALALARRLNPRCVLLDVSLPDMSGIDVCRALRTDPATTGCTIVMLTTHADSADKAEAFLVGADDYIVKPFAPRDLVARVHAAVRRRQTTTGAVGRQVDDALHEMLRMVRERERELGGGVALAGAGQLSSRQVEIVKRLLAGDRVPAIARDLFLSQSTVRNHLSVIYGRLGVHSQEELLVLLRKKSTGQRTASVAL